MLQRAPDRRATLDRASSQARRESPSQLDPTGTFSLRRSLRAEANRRLNALRRSTYQQLIERDFLGYMEPALRVHPEHSIRLFTQWFGALLVQTLRTPWYVPYLARAYSSGQVALGSMEPAGLPTFYIQQARADLDRVLAAIMERVLRRAGERALKPLELYRVVLTVLRTVGTNRLNAWANVQMVRLHNIGRLHHAKQHGVTHVDVVAEYLAQPYRDARPKRGETSVESMTAGDDRVCQRCKDIADRGPYDVETAESLLPQHPNCRCLLPGTRVDGVFLAASKAYYAGPAVEIVTMRGQCLRLTVNHPVLTARGLVAAGELRKDEHLVSYDGQIGRFSADNVQHGPALVEDVFRSFAKGGILKVGSSAVDFHGDEALLTGEVNIVAANFRLLEQIGQRYAQSGEQISLIISDAARGRSMRGSSLSFAGSRLHARPLDNFLRRSRSKFDALLGEDFVKNVALHIESVRQTFERCSASVFARDSFQLAGFEYMPGAARFADGHVMLAQPAQDDTHIKTQLLGQNVGRRSRLIAFDQVRELRHINFTGHVYDLQTETGYISAEGLAIKNCVFVVTVGKDMPGGVRGVEPGRQMVIKPVLTERPPYKGKPISGGAPPVPKRGTLTALARTPVVGEPPPGVRPPPEEIARIGIGAPGLAKIAVMVQRLNSPTKVTAFLRRIQREEDLILAVATAGFAPKPQTLRQRLVALARRSGWLWLIPRSWRRS